MLNTAKSLINDFTFLSIYRMAMVVTPENDNFRELQPYGTASTIRYS